MKVSTIFPLLTLGFSSLAAAADPSAGLPILNAIIDRVTSIQYLFEYGTHEKQEVVLEEGTGKVHEVTLLNWRDVLEDTDVDWLVLFTTGPQNCPGCKIYDETFDQARALLKDYPPIHFARVNCDDQALLCSVFGSWGARVYHVSHTNIPQDGHTIHKTHLHPVPFHRPGTESPPIVDENGKEKKAPPPPPDATWVAEAVRDETWKTFKEWDDWTQPFSGTRRELIYIWWWLVNLFSGIPPMAMMISIGLLSRWVTSRFTGRVLAPKPRPAPQAGAAKKTK